MFSIRRTEESSPLEAVEVAITQERARSGA